jgi:aspartyl-tRNA(Asn)/glutamyl-tRNA(Gln) amidotransferase subunit C
MSAPNPHARPEPLSADAVRKVASLSRLALTDAEVVQFQSQLGTVLTYIERLRELDLTGVEPLAHVGELFNRLRDDTPGPTLSNEQAMALAPDAMGAFYKVPKVLGDGGGA